MTRNEVLKTLCDVGVIPVVRAKSAETAKEAAATGKTLRDLILEKKLMTEKELARALDPKRITEPHDPTEY